MHQIEIDFDVFKDLTSRRKTEDVTYNDVIRELLGLKGAPKPVANVGRPWVVSGTSFPAGSQFTADYKGRTYSGTVKGGKLELDDGHRFSTPSAASSYIKGHNSNGWRFWKCKLPAASQYVPIERLRGKAH